MTSQAKFAKGATLTRAGNLIAEIKTLTGPNKSGAVIDVTTHDSPNGFREFIAGLRDGGELTIGGNFIPGDTNGQIGLNSDYEAGTAQSFALTFAAAFGTTITFTGIVTAFSNTNPHDGEGTFTATVKVTGKPTMAVATSTGLTTPFFALSGAAVVTPAPASDVYDYVATVLGAVTSVTVTPTATAGVITVNGNVVASGVASSAIPLGAAGTNTIITIVVTETNKAPKTYTIRVARAA